MDEALREFVESCDLVVCIGTVMTDFNTGAFTSRLDPEKSIEVRHHHVTVRSKVYPNIELKDLLAEPARRVTARGAQPSIEPLSAADVTGAGNDPITVEALHPRWAHFLRPNNILFSETGTSSMGLAFARMPKGASFHNQTLWGAIGWATPASFGAAVAAPNRRMVFGDRRRISPAYRAGNLSVRTT
jgi:indolepyruvate decarboxylase